MASASKYAWKGKDTLAALVEYEQLSSAYKELGQLSPSTASVILNAIYFNGKWAAPFNKKKTRQATFTTDGGVKRSVSMMSMTTESADY